LFVADGSYDNSKTVNGKKLVLAVFTGFFLMSIVCSAGTYAVSALLQPYLKSRDQAQTEALSKRRTGGTESRVQ
jgi:hypothetical protein